MKNGVSLSPSGILSALPSEIYESWLSSKGHTAMTGSPANVDSHVGGMFSAWDGYICGTTLELTPNQRIVQAWRTSEFPEDAPDSNLEVRFEEVDGSTRLTLTHQNMPEDQIESYRQGWEEFYFLPMKKYFR